jgi:hypothetical protein
MLSWVKWDEKRMKKDEKYMKNRRKKGGKG